MLTTTPEVVYLFVVLLTSPAGKVPFAELYQTTDKVACEAQATAWSAALTPHKFVCLAHSQKKLTNGIN